MSTPDDLVARLRAELAPGRDDGPVQQLLRTLGWTPPSSSPSSAPRPDGDSGELLDLLAAGCSVHEASARLGRPVSALREEIVALRREHACTSTAEVVRRVRPGH